MQNTRWNLGLALLFIAAGLVTLLVWIPTDVETGLIVEERRAVIIGDALAPTIAAVAILIFSFALAISTVLQGRAEASTEQDIGITKTNGLNLFSMGLILAISMALMVWSGPLTISLMQILGIDIKDYRLLTDTVPYKYIGFAVGGITLVAGLICWIEGKLTWRASLTGLGAVIVLIVVYDVPFETLLLPPNGSQ